MRRVIILDYLNREVHVFNVPKKVEDIQEFISDQYSEQGVTFDVNQCDWMLVELEENEGRLPIYIH